MLWSASPTTQRLRCFLAKRFHQYILSMICILILIYENMTKPVLVTNLALPGSFVKQSDCNHNQVIEIKSIGRHQLALVLVINACDSLIPKVTGILPICLRANQLILGIANCIQNRTGFNLPGIQVQVFDRFLDYIELINSIKRSRSSVHIRPCLPPAARSVHR